MRFLVLCLALVFVIFIDWSTYAQNQRKDPPTLIIAGGGMNTDGRSLFSEVDTLFETNNRGYLRTHVTFDGNQARIQGRPALDAELEQQAKLRGTGMQVGNLVARTNRALLELDMDLGGFSDLIVKGARGVVLISQNGGHPERQEQLDQQLDQYRTSWNRETERAAIFIEQAAREFKKQHPDGKVIVIGHSAFTDAINLVPTVYPKGDSNTGHQLIDLRLMSSNRMMDLKFHDPAHTVFVRHEGDLPSSAMGNLYSPQNRSPHELAQEGMVLHLKNRVEWSDGSQKMHSTYNPLTAHAETYAYDQVFDLEVRTNSAQLEFRGRPGDIIKRLVDDVEHDSSRVRDKFVESLKEQTHHESRVGGVTLTKPAEVAIDSNTVRALGVIRGKLALELKNGDTLQLPGNLNDEICATAAACVFGDQPPELTLMPFRDSDGVLWESVGYIGKNLAFTRLGDLMFEADRILADIAFGEMKSAVRPQSISNYHPYTELALDHAAFRENKIGGRVWVVPGIIRVSESKYGGRLDVDECAMAVRFEFYPSDRQQDYYQKNAKVAIRDPAGEYLGAQLTRQYPALANEFSSLRELRDTAVHIGVLIWAKQHGIKLTAAAAEWIKKIYTRNKSTRAYGNPNRNFKTIDNNQYEVFPIGEIRKVTERDISRPAVIFSQYGISRLLWADGTESRVTFDDAGRIEQLTSRTGQVSRFKYDTEHRLIGITDDHGEGIALLQRADFTVACYWAEFDEQREAFTSKEQVQLVPLADPAGFIENWIRTWMGAEATSTTPHHYRHALKNLGSSYSWLRWSERPIELALTLLTAIGLVSYFQFGFVEHHTLLKSRCWIPTTWALFLLWTTVVFGLLLLLEIVPMSHDLGGAGWLSWRLLPYILVPLLLLSLFRPVYNQEWGAGPMCALLISLGLLVAALIYLPESLQGFRSLLIALSTFLAATGLFNLFQSCTRNASIWIPKLSVLFIAFALAGFAWMRPSWSDLNRFWNGDGSLYPAVSRVDHFTQTSAVSLLPLVRGLAPANSHPSAALLGPILCLAVFGMPLECILEWQVARLRKHRAKYGELRAKKKVESQPSSAGMSISDRFGMGVVCAIGATPVLMFLLAVVIALVQLAKSWWQGESPFELLESMKEAQWVTAVDIVGVSGLWRWFVSGALVGTIVGLFFEPWCNDESGAERLQSAIAIFLGYAFLGAIVGLVHFICFVEIPAESVRGICAAVGGGAGLVIPIIVLLVDRRSRPATLVDAIMFPIPWLILVAGLTTVGWGFAITKMVTWGPGLLGGIIMGVLFCITVLICVVAGDSRP